MKRLVAVAALAAAVTPLAATAVPPEHRAVTCAKRYLVREQNVRDFMWCLTLRQS